MTGWHPWVSLGGSLLSGPTATSWAPGRLDVFYRPIFNPTAIAQRSYTTAGWSAEMVLPASGGLVGSTPTVVASAPGRLDLYMEGAAPGYNLLHTAFPNE
jgi:hypothetical protein